MADLFFRIDLSFQICSNSIIAHHEIQGGPNWTGPAYVFACNKRTHL